MSWYAVSTKPLQEKLAAQNMRRLGVETFLPQLKRNKSVLGKRRTVIGPLFPGYLFARFDMDTHYRAVNYTRGVRKVVTFGSVPAKVDDEMIESVKEKLVDGCLNMQPPSFTPGQSVLIQEGPLQGLEAIFEREMDDQQRVVLLLKALSYQARVVVELEHVAKC